MAKKSSAQGRVNVKGMYNELIATSLIINFFDALLTGVAAFSFGYFLSYFYRISIIFAIVCASILFVVSLIKKIKQNKILAIESRYPDLKERLRTSYDYMDQANTVINDLHLDILGMMQSVDVNTFINIKRTGIKIGLICIMLFSVLYCSSIGLDILDIRNAVVHSAAFKRASDFAADAFGQTRQQVKNRELLERPDIKNSGDKEQNISIDTYNTELDINQISNPQKNDFGGNYPEEIEGAAQETYQEKIPQEDKETVKEYFKKINE